MKSWIANKIRVAKESLVKMEAKWEKDLNSLPKFILAFALGIGIALTVLGAFAAGIGSPATNTVQNVIGYFNSNLVTFGSLIILVVFVAVIYEILHSKNLV